jgi:DNA mismatch endonuclease (patch repair protein)
MSRIQGKDTRPEMIVRKLVFAMGFRYRLHVRGLPGCPDLVFPARMKVILVHGCFWHRHSCGNGRVVPQTRKSFWLNKLLGNKRRDARNRRALRKLGWDVLIVWECQTDRTERLMERLHWFLMGT